MGVFDTIIFEKAYEFCGIAGGQEFQTKSLDPSGSRFIITDAGKLIVKSNGAVFDFHGDMVIYGDMPDNSFKYFVVRFTHGTLEWVRPSDEGQLARSWYIGA